LNEFAIYKFTEEVLESKGQRALRKVMGYEAEISPFERGWIPNSIFPF